MGRAKIMRQTFIKLWHDLRAFYLKTSQKREITVIITAVMLQVFLLEYPQIYINFYALYIT